MALIEEEMARQGVSQLELARRTDISGSQINELLRGKKSLRLFQLRRICHALGLDVAKVVTEGEKRAQQVGRGDAE